jgi:signal transduction histidine kinase
MVNSDFYIMFWIFEGVLLVALLIYIVLALRKLQKAAKEMADGNLDYRAEISSMPYALREHGENLNNIGDGLKTALAEKIKSEHMKAELITNVSHDIKTPLTSIVNYVDLLKKEGLESANAPEYLNVLERQSSKLKKLTEDLIDASKATTGCVSVNAEEMDVNVLLEQACGEYEGKLASCNLTPVMTLTEENPIIFADGGLVWRVFDNLFNNICKYSQKGTRVYLKTEIREEKVYITFSNISEAQLDISSDELMERFVRGDASRSTEGSGLGLSIARSLTELQKGTFDIKIDGDLFKVEMSFDRFAS